MIKSQILHLQRHVGAFPDGFWGPKSIAATQRHLRALMPVPHPFPTQSQVRSNRSVFGPRGVEGGHTPPMHRIRVPYKMYLYGDRSKVVSHISCHQQVSLSLSAVLHALEECGQGQLEAWGMTKYYGCYNARNVRGGNATSMHAYAIAVDFDAHRNGNTAQWPLKSHMPIEVMETFAKWGWLSAGAFWSRDAMHFQATKA